MKKQISPNILKSFLLIFISMAFMNSIIFGIAEYRDSRKSVLRDFKYLATSINRGLADTVWRSDKIEMIEIIDELLINYNISAIKIINSDTNFIEIFKVKNGREASIRQSSNLIFTYDNKKVRVAKLLIYTDNEAIFYRAKKTIALLLFKTMIESITIFILLFWAFKRLFSDYLSEIEITMRNKEYVPIDLEMKNSLPLLERAFRDVLNRFFSLYFNKDKNISSKEEKPEEIVEIEEVKEVLKMESDFDSNHLFEFANPNTDFFKRFLNDMFILSKPVDEKGGDGYLFIELEKGKEFLFLLADYGNNKDIKALELSIILKDIEKDLMLKFAVNNRLLALSKIVDFMDKKIKSKFLDKGINSVKDIEFKGLALHFDKINKKIEYSSKGVIILKDNNGTFESYDDYGLFGDRLIQHAGEVKKEHLIDADSNLYIVTDGFFKQVKKDKKREEIGKSGFMEIMSKVTKENFNTQELNFREEFKIAKGDKPQSDNVTIIGFNF